MPIVVITGNVIVVVLPVFCAGIVRRVNIDSVDGVPVRVRQHLQGVVVLRVDNRVERLVPAPLDPACLHQAGVDAVAELRNNNHIINEHSLRLELLRV